MNCPKCNGNTKCLGTASDYDAVHRRRLCKECGNIFFTIEIINEEDNSAREYYKLRCAVGDREQHRAKRDEFVE